MVYDENEDDHPGNKRPRDGTCHEGNFRYPRILLGDVRGAKQKDEEQGRNQDD